MDSYLYKKYYLGENPLNYMIRCEQLELIHILFFRLSKIEQRCLERAIFVDNSENLIDNAVIDSIKQKLYKEFNNIYWGKTGLSIFD